jgi:mRNA interferase MazF
VLLGELPGPFDDWLVCMTSSQLHQEVSGFDEVIRDSDADFARSGLKVASVLRISRLAVVEGSVLMGAVGEISPERLHGMRVRLARWIGGAAPIEISP